MAVTCPAIKRNGEVCGCKVSNPDSTLCGIHAPKKTVATKSAPQKVRTEGPQVNSRPPPTAKEPPRLTRAQNQSIYGTSSNTVDDVADDLVHEIFDHKVNTAIFDEVLLILNPLDASSCGPCGGPS